MAYSNIKDPSAHFQTALYTGTGNQNNSVVNDGNSDLQPDIVWMKSRNNGYSHYLVDSSRGRDKGLYPDGNNTEVTASTSAKDLQSFDTDGFTVGEPEDANSTNATSSSGVAWQWKANGGTTTTNTDGDINSTVQVNQEAGMSIVLYTPTNTTSRNIGHGLGAKPDCIIVRNRTRIESWRVWHHEFGNGACTLNALSGYTSNSNLVNTVTSTYFNVGTDYSVNGNWTYLAYCFKGIQGYSKFGKYIGNASTNGTFVYTGFKPAWIMIKATTTSTNWEMFDSKRNPSNVANLKLGANLYHAENGSDLGTLTQNNIDILSNGFKCRTANTDTNSNNTFMYLAFAENPFVAGGVPTTAR
jgi:hypothetical protein